MNRIRRLGTAVVLATATLVVPVVAASPAAALDNGLARTPYMG